MGNGCTVRSGPAACLANARLNSGNAGCTITSFSIAGLVCCRNDYLVNSDCAIPPPRIDLSIAPIAPLRGQLLTNVSVPLNYEVSMDITIAAGATPAPSWGSIVHFTATGNDGGSGTAVLGDRIPAVWFHPGTWNLYVIDGGDAAPTATNFDNICPLGALGTLRANGATTNLRIVMRPVHFRVYINGTLACNEARSDRRTWPSVMVYVGDPWYDPAPNTQISNFTMLEALPMTQEFIGASAMEPAMNQTLVSNVILPLNYELGFTIVPRGTWSHWSSIVHVDAVGQNYGVLGSRIPSVFFYPSTTRLHIADGGGPSVHYNDYCDTAPALPLNAATTVRIVMQSNRVWIYQNGTVVCTEPRSDRVIWSNASIYFSDP